MTRLTIGALTRRCCAAEHRAEIFLTCFSDARLKSDSNAPGRIGKKQGLRG